MNIKFNIRGIDKINEFLKKLPRGAMRTAIKSITEYILGNDRRGLRHYEPYKYVTRKSAYGVTFFSEKQRRYVMAKIRSGEIKPGQSNRTGKTSAAWEMKETKGGYGYNISNNTAGGYFTRSDTGQARQPAKVGWRKTSAVISANIAGAMRQANADVKKWIEENKKKG